MVLPSLSTEGQGVRLWRDQLNPKGSTQDFGEEMSTLELLHAQGILTRLGLRVEG